MHAGDAAQTQHGISFRYEPLDHIYLKVRGTYFDDYYSDFDPLSLDGENAGENHGNTSLFFIDFHAGYTLKLNKKAKTTFV